MSEYYLIRDSIFKAIASKDDMTLMINCSMKHMPEWVETKLLRGVTSIDEEEAFKRLGIVLREETEMSLGELKTARERYTMVAGILPFLTDDRERNHAIKKVCENFGKSRRTITSYLCKYLVTGSITSLADKQKNPKEKGLTIHEKNMRWALNKYYYTRHGNKLTDVYVMLLKEKYTDADNKLVENYPSIYQFRYFFNKTRKKQTEIISREGLKNYQLNYRPLLGEGVQEYAPNVGVGMVDSTVCDIYLVDKAGKLLGRPILVGCVDAYSGLCMGYALVWEGGVYSCRELLLNVIHDKVAWCRKFGILIEKEDWDCAQLPGVIVSDRGSEYISFNFEQITELGVQVISLPAFSANQKGPVEKLFDLVQSSFKPYLKGKGVVESDIGLRGVRDYRKDACLTIEQFEKILLHCIVYHNRSRILEDYPFTEKMLQEGIAPYPAAIWNFGKEQPGANLITVPKEQLILTMLPRTTGKFSRHGLEVNGMRYTADGYTERYLKGGKVTVAYNPDDVSSVYLVEDMYKEFSLIERRYKGKALEEVVDRKKKQKEHISQYSREGLQAKIELAQHIEAVAGQAEHNMDTEIKGTLRRRKKARTERHRNLMEEI